MKLSLTGVWLGQGAVVVLAAVLTMSGEYGMGTIRTALTTEPVRLRILAAKAAVLCALTATASTVGVLGSLLAGGLLLSADGFAAPTLTEGPTLRAAAGTVLYLTLTALIGLGAATALRDTAGGARDRRSRAIQATIDLDRLPIGPWAGIAVLAGYAVAALVTGGGLLRVRDA